MRAVQLALVLGVAGCNLGIGSDPTRGDIALVCAPGHARETADGPCVTKLVPAIAIDGQTTDWTDVPAFPIIGGTLAIAGDNVFADLPGEVSDLLLRATFEGGPLDVVELDLAPSPARPASGGSDRLTLDASGIHYEKNGMAVTPAKPQLVLAWTADGFEAMVPSSWLAYQGALRLELIGSRAGGDVIHATQIDACFGFRTGYQPLPSNACEVAP